MFAKIKSLDYKVLHNISRLHCPSLNIIMKTASRSANVGIIWWLITLPLLIRLQWRASGFTFAVALAFAYVIGEGLIKHVVKSIRPCHTLDDEKQRIHRPIFYSFPSGHTTASFAMVGVSVLRCQVITFVPIIILASLISFSRIYLRVHYLTDVIAGVLLGTSCGMLSVLFFAAIGLY